MASGGPGLVTDTTARTWPHGDQCHVSQSELLERLAFQQQLLQALDAYVEKYGVTYPSLPQPPPAELGLGSFPVPFCPRCRLRRQPYPSMIPNAAMTAATTLVRSRSAP